jgi:hypothetical protein
LDRLLRIEGTKILSHIVFSALASMVTEVHSICRSLKLSTPEIIDWFLVWVSQCCSDLQPENKHNELGDRQCHNEYKPCDVFKCRLLNLYIKKSSHLKRWFGNIEGLIVGMKSGGGPR